jgi:lipase chaperone LimK
MSSLSQEKIILLSTLTDKQATHDKAKFENRTHHRWIERSTHDYSRKQNIEVNTKLHYNETKSKVTRLWQVSTIQITRLFLV